jgi:hypothetical protein
MPFLVKVGLASFEDPEGEGIAVLPMMTRATISLGTRTFPYIPKSHKTT